MYERTVYADDYKVVNNNRIQIVRVATPAVQREIHLVNGIFAGRLDFVGTTPGASLQQSPDPLYFTLDPAFMSNWSWLQTYSLSPDQYYQNLGGSNWSASYALQLVSNPNAGPNYWFNPSPYWPYLWSQGWGEPPDGGPICNGSIYSFADDHLVNAPNSAYFAFNAQAPGQCFLTVVTTLPDSHNLIECAPLDVDVFGALTTSASSLSLSQGAAPSPVTITQTGLATFSSPNFKMPSQIFSVDASNCTNSSIAASDVNGPQSGLNADSFTMHITPLQPGSCTITVTGVTIPVVGVEMYQNQSPVPSPPQNGSYTSTITIPVTVTSTIQNLMQASCDGGVSWHPLPSGPYPGTVVCSFTPQVTQQTLCFIEPNYTGNYTGFGSEFVGHNPLQATGSTPACGPVNAPQQQTDQWQVCDQNASQQCITVVLSTTVGPVLVAVDNNCQNGQAPMSIFGDGTTFH